jgi:two-component system LytT family response regulator
MQAKFSGGISSLVVDDEPLARSNLTGLLRRDAEIVSIGECATGAQAVDEYALRAFDVGALDYLLKPFDDSRFHLAMLRAKEKISHRRALAPPAARRLAVKRAGQVSFVQIADIDWIEAADYYTSLHVGEKSYLLRRSMGDLQRELDSTEFCRIHRSTIVNLRRVRALEVSTGGEYEVILASGERLRLSRRFRKDLQSRLGTCPAPSAGQV